MIEIIKHGNTYKEPKTCICSTCKCEFKYTAHDRYFYPPMQSYFIRCPECHNDNCADE